MPRLCDQAIWKDTLVLALLVQFLLALAMMASPTLHERLHHGADHHDHECLVTVMHAGGTEGPSTVPVLVVAPSFLPVATIVETKVAEIGPLFLTARVFEHAPPLSA